MSDRYHYVYTGWSDWKTYKLPNGQETCDKVRSKNFACYKGNYNLYPRECQKAIGPAPRVEEYNSDKCQWLFYSADYSKCNCQTKKVPIKYFCPSAFGNAPCGKNTNTRLYSDCPLNYIPKSCGGKKP
jgi:hypothetical protein